MLSLLLLTSAMDALAADFCPPKNTIVETIAAAPSRLARFCFSFSLSSEDDSDEDATIEKDFSPFLFDDDDALLLMKILLPDGFCSRLDDDRIVHLSFFDEESREEEPKKGTKAALPLLLIEAIENVSLAVLFSAKQQQQQQ